MGERGYLNLKLFKNHPSFKFRKQKLHEEIFKNKFLAILENASLRLLRQANKEL